MDQRPWLKSLIDSFKTDFWKNKTVLLIFSIALLANLSIWILLYFKLEPNEYPIPIHYNIYTGIDVVDYWYKVYTMPTMGLLILIINFMLGIVFYVKNRLIAYLLAFGALIVQIMLIVSGLMIIYGL